MRRSAVLLPTAILALLCAGALTRVEAGAGAAPGDQWGVRRTGDVVETLSDVGAQGHSARMPALAALASRRRGGLSIALAADAATARRFVDAGILAPELEAALARLEQLRGADPGAIRLQVALVAEGQRLRVRRRHPLAAGLVVDLVVPVDAQASRSAEAGRALGVALHEASHLLRPAGMDRAEDEYRAALVEACYRIDTLRVGDTLRLQPRAGASASEYFVTGRSRDAARAVVGDLVRAAGTDTIDSRDATGLLGLHLACAIRLAG